MLVAAGMINYIDRAALSIGSPLIRDEFGLSIADMGLLLSVFLWAYSFTQLPVGGLVDRFGPRKMLGLGLFVWSVAQAASALTTGFMSFAATRAVLGIGESPQFSSCIRVVRDWYNVRERGLPTGLFAGSSALGTAIAGPILTFLMLQFGWRWMFAIMGLLGIFLAIVWYIFYRDVDTAALTEDEVEYLSAEESREPPHKPSLAEWLRLMRLSPTWGVVLGFVGTTYLSWLYTAWLPSYLSIDRHISLPKTGILVAIPFLCSMGGTVSGGLFTQWLILRKISPLMSVKVTAAGGTLGMSIFTIFAAEVSSTPVAITCLSIAMFLGGISLTNAWTMIGVVAPRAYVGSLAGMKNFVGYLGGAMAPTVTGFIVQSTGSFEPALITAAVIGVSSAFIYFFGVRRTIDASEITGVSSPSGK